MPAHSSSWLCTIPVCYPLPFLCESKTTGREGGEADCQCNVKNLNNCSQMLLHRSKKQMWHHLACGCTQSCKSAVPHHLHTRRDSIQSYLSHIGFPALPSLPGWNPMARSAHLCMKLCTSNSRRNLSRPSCVSCCTILGRRSRLGHAHSWCEYNSPCILRHRKFVNRPCQHSHPHPASNKIRSKNPGRCCSRSSVHELPVCHCMSSAKPRKQPQ